MTATVSRHHNGLPPAVSKAGKIPAPRPFPFMMLPVRTTGSRSNPNRTVEINISNREREESHFCLYDENPNRGGKRSGANADPGGKQIYEKDNV